MLNRFVSLTADIATLEPQPADTSNESFGSNESSWRKSIYEVF